MRAGARLRLHLSCAAASCAAARSAACQKKERVSCGPKELSADQWRALEEHGWVKVGKVISDGDLALLQRRIDDIMLGDANDVDYGKMMMQLDSSTGKYSDIGQQTFGHKGRTLAYRKIQNLDEDPVFLAYCQLPIFEHVCRAVYGSDEAISSFRTMFFNKPANQGTPLPWHQDRWIHLDKDPKITVYTALDDATLENGCVQFIPGSHKLEPQAEELVHEGEVVNLELHAGEVVIFHNWTVHRSGINSTDRPRRAFSVNYMLSSTNVVRHDSQIAAKGTSTGHAEGCDAFPTIFSAQE